MGFRKINTKSQIDPVTGARHFYFQAQQIIVIILKSEVLTTKNSRLVFRVEFHIHMLLWIKFKKFAILLIK